MTLLARYPNYEQLTRVFAEVESGDNFYLSSYPNIIQAAKILNDDEHGNSIALLAHASYGWMPTVLSAISFDVFFGIDRKPLTRIRGTNNFRDLIRRLPKQSPINNSWIGMSKFLHFLNPQTFPIWDSRVAKHFGLKYQYQYNKKDCYEEYVDWLTHFSINHNFKFLRMRVFEKYGYKITRIRAAEMSLFFS